MKSGWAFFAALVLTAPVSARTPAGQEKVLDQVGFVQNLNAQLPLDLPFRDEQGKDVKLGDYFGKKPVLLNFVYFECPMLCTEVLNGMIRTLRGMSLSAGKHFNIVTVSIDPKEGPALASDKKRVYLEKYKRAGAEAGWAFLTGNDSSIKPLADAAGFQYVYDKEIDQYAHASGIVIVTPDGKISRYYFGVEYPVREVRLSLVEASSGRIGSAVDKFLLYCYHYNPETGRYGVAIMRVLRVAGLCTLLSLVSAIFFMVRSERRAA